MKRIVVVPVRKTRTMRCSCRLLGSNCWLSLSLIALFALLTVCLPARAEENPILDPGGHGAATNLQSEIACGAGEDRKGLVTLKWKPAEKQGKAQQVDVTIFKHGFKTRQFKSSKRLSASQSLLIFKEVTGQALHRWRVLTLQPEGWVPSGTARFTGPTCVIDEGSEGKPPVIK